MAIKKFDIKTPGRSSEEVKLYSKKEYRERQSGESVKAITNDAGENKDTELVYSIIEGLGGSEVVRKKNSVQVIFGARVITIASKIKAVLGVN